MLVAISHKVVKSIAARIITRKDEVAGLAAEPHDRTHDQTTFAWSASSCLMLRSWVRR